jgi:O-antigen/teichoic acid export membrane protein
MFQRIQRNASFLILGQAIVSLFFIIQTLFLAYFLGVEGIGMYAFAFAVSYIFVTIANLGFKDYMTREIAQSPESGNALFSVILRYKHFTSIPYFLGIFLLSIFLSNDYVFPLLLASIGVLIESFLHIFFGYFRALQKMKIEGISLILQSATTVFVTVLLLFLGVGIISPFVGHIFGSSSALLFVVFSKKNINVVSQSSEVIPFLLKSAFPFLVLELIALLIYRTDVVMLTLLQNVSSSGIYEAGYMIVKELELIPYFIAIAFYPVFAKGKHLALHYRKSMLLLLLTSGGIVGLLFLFGERIISLLYGSGFEDSFLVLKILALGSIFLFINFGNYYYLHARGKSVINVLVFACAIAINIILNYLLIPMWSYVGSAIATAISYLCIIMIESYIVHILMRKENG